MMNFTTITVYPTTICPYSSQVYAGLFDLQAARCASVKISLATPTIPVSGHGVLYIEAEREGVRRRIMFDLVDTWKVSFPDLAENIDMVAKRTYIPGRLNEFSPELIEKVVPYGINYNCVSANSPNLRLFLSHQFSELKRHPRLHLFKNNLMRYNTRFLLSSVRNSYTLEESSYRNDIPEPRNGILFITRLFPNSNTNTGLAGFSLERIELVRKLKERFGSDFLGGVEDDEIGRKHCPPDLLFSRIPRDRYIQLLKSSQITMVTVGANRSNPWKLGEALATSGCILSGELETDLPVQLRDGIEYLVFSTPDQCVQMCEYLMQNPAEAKRHQRAAQAYYDQNVKADMLIASVLDRAFKM